MQKAQVMNLSEFVSMVDISLRNLVMDFKNSEIKDVSIICTETNYRHFKGKWYRLLDIAERNGNKFCIYQPLYGDTSLVWCRPFDMFFSETDHEAYPNVKQKWRLEGFHEIVKEKGEAYALELFYKEMNIHFEGDTLC